jgi:hypothetical protein
MYYIENFKTRGRYFKNSLQKYETIHVYLAHN